MKPLPSRPASSMSGMTLVEILIAITITTVISLAGWRAIDVLQQARDRARGDALTWQRVETIFESLESDLRRAEFRDFTGTPEALRLSLVPFEGTRPPVPVEWRWIPNPDGRWFARRTEGASAWDIDLGAEAVRLAFSPDGRAWNAESDAYPLALRLTLRLPGQRGDIERLFVLR